MTLTEIEQEFHQIIPQMIDDLNRYNQIKHLDFGQGLELDFMSSFHTCVVGNVRYELGLSKSYAFLAEPDKKCLICQDIATRLYDATALNEYRDKNDYTEQLKRLKTHLKREHNKELKKEVAN